MPDLWMPGATRLDIGDHAPTDGGPAKAIAHITWDRNATAAKPADLVPYENLVDYFGRNSTGKAAAPHIIWDPFTGRFTQLVPANSRSKSVVDVAGGTRTNRAGSVVIQIEAVFFPYCRVNGVVYARLVDTPCAGWGALNAWVASWGVPNRWPMGRPTSFAPNRSEAVWEREAGWYGHSQVPENDHQDPGSWPDFTSGGGGTPAPSTPARYQVTINGLVYGYGAHGDHVTAVGRALVSRGFGSHYQVGPGPDWSDADTECYADYQRSLGYSGADADGVPGDASLRGLLGTLPGSGQASTPTVSLSGLIRAARADVPAPDYHLTYREGVLIVERALNTEGLLAGDWVDGSYGSKTVTAYAAWQRKLGFSGSGADGIPGKTSLTRLGAAHGFQVVD